MGAALSALVLSGCVQPSNVDGVGLAIEGPDFIDNEAPYRFPAVVTVNGTECTGTLISPSHVLTAAHCVHSSVPMLVGFLTDETRREIGVARCFMNPSWTTDHIESLRDEFAGLDTGDRCGVLNLPPGALAEATVTSPSCSSTARFPIR